MSCDELREHYELYALGVAEEPERSEIRAHLDRQCEACRSGIRQALGLMAALGAGAPSAAPPARLRRRLVAAAGVPERHYGWPLAWAAAALLCFAAAVYFSGRERQFAEDSQRLRRELADRTTELRRLQEAFAILNAPGTTEVVFGAGQPAPPAGRVFVNASRGVMMVASHLPPAPAGKAYEMWIIPKGGAPRPAGLFQAFADQTAIHVEPGAVDVAATAAVAVTLENDAGSPQPTSQPLIVAALPPAGR